MKKLLYIIILFFPLISYSQYLEDFDTANKGLEGPCSDNNPSNCTGVSDFVGETWTVSGNLSGAMEFGGDISKTVSGEFSWNHLHAGVAEVCWESPTLDISATPTASLSIALIWENLDRGPGDDYMHVEYRIDGGAYTPVARVAGSGTNTVEFIGTDPMDDNDGSGTASATGIVGSTLDIRVCVNNKDFNANCQIDNVSVPEAGVVILPIELASFQGKKMEKAVNLSWKTFTETNNDYFSIQKSTNGKDFQEIATQKGAGTTLEAQDYSFMDERPVNGINYYRLMQMDYDGQFSYSKVISVDFRNEETISIFPNPAKESLQISTKEAWTDGIAVYIYSVNGQLMQQIQLDDVENTLDLDIQDLPTGMYSVQVIANGAVFSQKFVKE